MILNKEYKFIFVHIQKNAGSSIKKSLFSLDNSQKHKYSHSFIDTEIENFEEYFKFCFVRNPWDRLVSWYNMMLNKGIHNDFSKYLLKNSKNFSEFISLTEIIYEKNQLEWDEQNPYPKSISFNQLDYISDSQGKILVDFIGKYENLESDFNFIKNKISNKIKPLEHINKYNHKEYKKYYTDIDIEKVHKMYNKDIEYFGYTFEG